MRTVHFIQSADQVSENDVKGRIAVVADVLRATSTIVTALHNGCRAVIPVKEVEEAFATAARFNNGEYILGGERQGKPVPGFHFGNSPREYTLEAVAGKTVITTTTNGTRALVNSSSAHEVLVLSFLNLSAIAARLAASDADVCLVAAGIYGEFSLEDSVCCGFLANRLGADVQMTSAARRVAELAANYEGRILDVLHDSPHGVFLERIGYGADLAVCARLDACPVTPVYRDGSIRLVAGGNVGDQTTNS